jgi:hypothetical protein
MGFSNASKLSDSLYHNNPLYLYMNALRQVDEVFKRE